MLLFAGRNKCFIRRLIDHGNVQLTLRMTRSTVGGYESEEYQYLQISKTPTMHFQPSLPHLAIPTLADTCRRYINAQKPLLSEEQLEKTKSYVSEFLSKDGLTLHKELLDRDAKNRHTSYISEPWFDMYLRDRKPLPINYNPLLAYSPESQAEYNMQLVKATNLVISSLRFMKSLRSNVLTPEVYHINRQKSDTVLFHTVTRLLPPQLSCYGAYLFKAYPLDMSQYHNLFNTTRIPRLEKDEIYQDTSARHILVMRGGHFYAVDVLDENGNIRGPMEIAASLKFILEDNRPRNETPIGVLTGAERNQWAQARAHLSEIGNAEVLRKIDSAIFAMMLDDVPGDDYGKLLGILLHADGTNRWFDKSFSIIITKDGFAGINFEHSWGDGVAVLRYFNDVKTDISNKPMFHPTDVNHLDKRPLYVKKLDFTVDDKTRSVVEAERRKYEEWTNSLRIDHIVYGGFGRNECKRLGVSPDAMMQLGFQLAMYIQEGCTVPTYESCSTAAFKHGRTETIRPCTMETKEFCTAIVKDDSDFTKLKRLIANCSKVHSKLTMEAAMGQGFDRHLFALRKIWEETGTPKPAIFEDPAYERINRTVLSTSTLSSAAIAAGGFGPVIEDGYGIGYMTQDTWMGAVVTSYKNHRQGEDYVGCLEEALQCIRRVLLQR